MGTHPIFESDFDCLTVQMSNKFFGRSLRLPYYAVAVGRKPGIYPTHAQCEIQIKNFENACWAKLGTYQDAEDFLREFGTPEKSLFNTYLENPFLKMELDKD